MDTSQPAFTYLTCLGVYIPLLSFDFEVVNELSSTDHLLIPWGVIHPAGVLRWWVRMRVVTGKVGR